MPPENNEVRFSQPVGLRCKASLRGDEPLGSRRRKRLVDASRSSQETHSGFAHHRVQLSSAEDARVTEQTEQVHHGRCGRERPVAAVEDARGLCAFGGFGREVYDSTISSFVLSMKATTSELSR